MPEVNVGSRIRDAREALGWSQHALAKRVGVSQRAVSYVEKQSWVKQATLQKYAPALGKPVSYFLQPYGEGAVSESALNRQETVEQAFAVVCRDPEFGFGARPGEQLSLETKNDIVRLYERYKGISLLPGVE
jgi:transcriptional regulator with XRE-family HTH domain